MVCFKNERITIDFNVCLDGEPFTKLPLFIFMSTANLNKHRSICMTRVVVCFWNGIKCVVWYTTIMHFANMKCHPVIWIKLLLRHKSGPKLAQVMACCLKAPSHYLNQCWLSISKVLCHSSEDPIKRNSEGTNQERKLGNWILKLHPYIAGANELVEMHHHVCLSLSDSIYIANILIDTQYHGATNHVMSYTVYNDSIVGWNYTKWHMAEMNIYQFCRVDLIRYIVCQSPVW